MAPPNPTLPSLVHLFDVAAEPGALLEIAAVLDSLPIAIGIAERFEGKVHFLHLNYAAKGVFRDDAPVPPYVSEHPLPTPPGQPQRLMFVGAACNADARTWRLAAQWGLTSRQATVLQHVAHGAANKDIAAVLGLAEATVEMHMTALFRAAGVEGRAGLVAAFWTR